MRPSGKWIEAISADGSVEDAASRSLEARLTAVNYWLPLAAYLAEQDIEHVHRLRVSTRRAMAAIELYREWLPRKPARWLRKRLKKIRRAAGEARDLDVLAERLARDYGERAAPVIAIMAARRAAVQPAIIRIAERCRRRDRFMRKAGKLLAGIRLPKEHQRQPICFRNWAAKQLTDAASSFFAALPGETADTAALHQFRIRGKSLRYTMELVAPAFGPELRNEYYPVVERLQERLGKIQDHVTAAARLSHSADDVGNDSQQERLRVLAVEETARVNAELSEFRTWWTAKRAEALRQGLIPEALSKAVTPPPQVAHQT